jgi:putative membrane protein
MTKVRDISASRVARSLCFLAISFFISWLAQTGKLAKIVHPRMNPWIEAAGALFLVLAFVQTLRISERPSRPDPLSFYIPIAFILAIAAIFVGSEAFQPGRFEAGGDSLAVQNAIISKRDKAAAEASKGALPALISFDDDRYWTLYNRLYDEAPAAVGKRVVIRGFLYRKAGLPEGTALIGRNLMWCCSADMGIIGLLARGPAVAGLKPMEWVEASGRLGTISFDMNGDGKDYTVPVIALDSLKSADKGSSSSVIFPF